MTRRNGPTGRLRERSHTRSLVEPGDLARRTRSRDDDAISMVRPVRRARSIASSSPSVTPLGTVIGGRFRVDQLLGSGGMGVVVAATHLELGHRVAIKVLRDEM